MSDAMNKFAGKEDAMKLVMDEVRGELEELYERFAARLKVALGDKFHHNDPVVGLGMAFGIALGGQIYKQQEVPELMRALFAERIFSDTKQFGVSAAAFGLKNG
ncbi:hypothetical protein I6H96_02775 [Brucella anthropi]|uniref:Uncharacterized protein n=1 Tax=Brucella anthropi (strain ATCC 49188 / DSM 6882 / CCUG 24695 / JCM 21032 / LMG 3331 / NBRC 15819 / NCTC 12168 / Alc 37) TaxID=439375 RepID=A6WZ67_BRUA4|nr:hypothetical protein [Brucella anthropi]ABS14271.1 hypothetical protein Oant_1555 [Brucella anthropi ATCC 49188]NKC48157.1 hypothetical protein [Brucella anthropi ATCC 49188]QQC25805.1 hypothetical protein I6H96_02775 [Brucella anthropi]RRY08872.1 hypothetical protein EGJ58_13320 [Brucella anthropi]SUA65363.1 Uncharacterised protein [Brucella anthropi]